MISYKILEVDWGGGSGDSGYAGHRRGSWSLLLIRVGSGTDREERFLLLPMVPTAANGRVEFPYRTGDSICFYVFFFRFQINSLSIQMDKGWELGGRVICVSCFIMGAIGSGLRIRSTASGGRTSRTRATGRVA